MICKACNIKIETNLDKCPICQGELSPGEIVQDLPQVDEDNNNMLNWKFLVVFLIALLALVIVKTIFFPNVESMPKYKMEYGLAIKK